jgi:hypothetical protein
VSLFITVLVSCLTKLRHFVNNVDCRDKYIGEQRASRYTSAFCISFTKCIKGVYKRRHLGGSVCFILGTVAQI